jgi:FKBP-type peptidyl-prolyl cis-trans isomerase
MRLPSRLIACLLAVAWAAFPGALVAGPRAEFSEDDEKIITERWPDAMTTPSGMRFVLLKDGAGPTPRYGQRIKVLFRGTLLDGTEFGKSEDPKDPFVFTLGTRKVIAGWEEAFATMRAGEKRVLIIPHALAFGLLGRPPDIPNRATLIFDVELVSFE